MTEFDDEDPLAVWEAAFLPDWEWEAYDVADEGLYFGRVKSPLTEQQWEWGYFSVHQLREAKAYRIDSEYGRLFPSGGDELTYDELADEIMNDAVYDCDWDL